MNLDELLEISLEHLETIQALTGLKIFRRILQHKLQQSFCVRIVLTYLEKSKLFSMQTLAKEFYSQHIPIVIETINIQPFSSFVSQAGIYKIVSELCPDCSLAKLYDASDHNFSIAMFHELCDEIGPTLSIF